MNGYDLFKVFYWETGNSSHCISGFLPTRYKMGAGGATTSKQH